MATAEPVAETLWWLDLGTAPQTADLIGQPDAGTVTLALIHVGTGQFIRENGVA
jgi:hypothetical protein